MDIPVDDINSFCNAAANGDLAFVKKMIETYGPEILEREESVYRGIAMTWAASRGPVSCSDLGRWPAPPSATTGPAIRS